MVINHWNCQLGLPTYREMFNLKPIQVRNIRSGGGKGVLVFAIDSDGWSFFPGFLGINM